MTIGSIVRVKERFEVTPLNFLDCDAIGVVTDETTPNYYRVSFSNKYFGCYWIEGSKLEEVRYYEA